MSVEAQAFSTDELTLGMYVSKLDRPWLETPFLFQGFYIESQDVIDELRRYCKYVYVDVEKSDHTITLAAGPAAGEACLDERTKKRNKPKATPEAQPTAAPAVADDTVLLKAELINARDTHEKAECVIEELFQKIRSGEEIEITNIQRAMDPMIESILRNDDAMSWLARMKKKHDYVYDHSIASSVWAVMFGKHLGLGKDDLQVLGMGAIFMDVGKTRIPTKLLVKREPLNNQEMDLMRNHVDFGVEIVSKIKGIDRRVIEMVQGHHERYNGTGYPRGLSGAAIPIYARIAGIVDTYDAMTTPRPYAQPRSTYEAMRQLNNLAGVEFPAEVVEQFVQAVGVFPVGTLVELNTGEVGVVIAQNRIRRLRPKIMVLLNGDKQPLETFPIVDLRNQLADARGECSLWIDKGLAPGDYGLDPSEYYL